MKYFKAIKVDSETKCLILNWEDPLKLWGVLDIANIVKIVHIVENFSRSKTSNEKFLLNKYLWR